MGRRLSDLVSAIINADSYKVGHFIQYPEGTEYVSSYIEARSSKYAKMLGPEYDFVEFFGMQMFVKEYLTNPVTQDDIDLAEVLFRMHGEPFNKEGWQYVVDHHKGMLPIEVRALPEGSVVPTSRALAEIINTDPVNCGWLTSYVETATLRAVWYPTTVATKSRIIKEICRKALEETCDDVDDVLEKMHMDLGPSLSDSNFAAAAAGLNILNFMLHDFGARGASSMESSAIAGAAHLVNFRGTDTVMGIIAALAFYYPEYEQFLAETPENPKKAMTRMLLDMEAKGRPLPGLSVEASEHSTMTIKGREGEKEQIKKLIDRAKQGKIVSIVSDSYDYFNNVMNVFGDEFKADIMEASRNGGRVVIRPDSGDPVEVITKTLEILGEKFKDEIKTNRKGYKVLPPGLRILQGDGIDMDTVGDILKAVQAMGFSLENIVFGMGGGLEQKVNRDDLNFAQKASAACIKGIWYDVFKDPITQAVEFVKQSKKGRLSTIWNGVAVVTKRTADLVKGETDAMLRIFRNGKTYNEQCFDGIVETAEFFMALHRLKPTEPVEKPWAKASRHNASMGI